MTVVAHNPMFDKESRVAIESRFAVLGKEETEPPFTIL
jgi:hypothetical protein